MSDDFAPDEDIAATIKDAVQEADDRNTRINEFAATVLDHPGQLGVLFRQICHAYNEFCSAERFGGVTVGEEIRISGVLDEAMTTLDWLREGTS